MISLKSWGGVYAYVENIEGGYDYIQNMGGYDYVENMGGEV